jgi:hypothetical protein
LRSTEAAVRADSAFEANLPPQGSCFGFQIRSQLRFSALRDGNGGPPLRIDVRSPFAAIPTGELVYEWKMPGFDARVFFDGRRYGFLVEGIGWFVIDPARSTISLPAIDDPALREELLWAVPIVLCFLERGDVPLHAAAVEINGGAVLLAAPGTYGKSTLAAAFSEAGYRLLSEDLVCLRSASVPAVLPGPATLRLRPDVAEQMVIRSAERVPGSADRRRFSLRSDARGDGRPVPLRAILLLRNSEGPPTVAPLAVQDAIPDLWALSLRLRNDDGARCFQTLVEAAGSVPVFNLRRRLRIDDLPATVACVVDAVS